MTLDISVTDMFCGAGGSTTGATLAGATVKLAINHWHRAIETHNTNYPEVTHALTDLHKANPRRFPTTTILIASPECFPVGTLILTARGLISIENIQVGDNVLTHQNRWRPVTQIMSRTASTLIVKGQGHPGIEVTAEHPFFVREQTKIWDNEKRDYNRRVYGDPTWVASSSLVEKRYRWATPVAIAALTVPPVPDRGMPLDDPEFWWLVGRWIGDGTVRCREGQGGEITLSCGNHKADELEQRLKYWHPEGDIKRAGDGRLRWRRRGIRTATLFECGHQNLALWLVEHFGKLAHGKTLPTWAFSLSRTCRQSLLDGYLSADGHSDERATSATTVSKRLALGIRLLAESLGYRTSLGCSPQHANVIEGRKVNVRDLWTVRWENNASQRTAFADETHAWSLIKQIVPGHEQVEVFNLSVEEDESYVADGIVVHNCTSHSLSKGKKRKGQGQPELWDNGPDLAAEAEERSRCTMWTPLDWAEYHDYQAVILENVVDAHLWRPFQAWLQAWKSLGYEFEIVYLNSMFAHPTPQSRDRMYFVAWKRGNRKPNLQITPLAYCPKCERDVSAVQAWKSSTKRYGKYKQQYVYVCPTCVKPIAPYYYAAATAIDWSLPAARIRDRKNPLREKTLNRITEGLTKYASKTFTLNLNHSEVRPLAVSEQPFFTQTAYDSTGLVTPPFIIDHIAEYRVRSIDEPLSTIVGGGNHQSLIAPSWLMTYYNNGQMVPVTQSTPTVTTLDRHALITGKSTGSLAVEDCGFRMLVPKEIQSAMAFPQDYVVTGTRREQVKQLGNAVTPPAMKVLMERVIASLSEKE